MFTSSIMRLVSICPFPKQVTRKAFFSDCGRWPEAPETHINTMCPFLKSYPTCILLPHFDCEVSLQGFFTDKMVHCTSWHYRYFFSVRINIRAVCSTLVVWHLRKSHCRTQWWQELWESSKRPQHSQPHKDPQPGPSKTVSRELAHYNHNCSDRVSV